MFDKVKLSNLLTMSYLSVNNISDYTGVFDNIDLFPSMWVSEVDEDTKCKILQEAIEKH